MAIPILHFWRDYFANPDEGLGSSYERIILNRKLEAVRRLFDVRTVLEAPSFGFTGLSGINSMALARSGCAVTLADHDNERLRLIEGVWQDVGLPLHTVYSPDYRNLPFPDGAFDLSWNFSALWFAPHLDAFLAELARVTGKVMLLCVPNRTGLGYLSQKMQGREDLRRLLREEHIMPSRFLPVMQSLGWKLLEWDYIDCPPWPDIGMHKEKLLRKMGLGALVREPAQPRPPLTILNHYRGADDDFPAAMMRHAWFERGAPRLAKHFWAHHRYHLLVREA